MFVQKFKEDVKFVLLRDKHDGLSDVYSNLFRLDFNTNGFVEQSMCKFHDVWGKCGRKEKTLFLFGKKLVKSIDVLKKSHIQHSVDFIKHPQRSGGERNMFFGNEIKKSTGGGDYNVDRVIKGFDLCFNIDATK